MIFDHQGGHQNLIREGGRENFPVWSYFVPLEYQQSIKF